jgi:hypothetical protein
MTSDRERPPLEPVRSSGRGQTSRLVLLVATLFLIAIIKPWDLAGTRRPAASVPAVQPSSRTAEPSLGRNESAVHPETEQCFVGASWRVFTVEQNLGRRVRSWIGVEPIVAKDRPPLAQIPAIRLLTEKVDSLGFCSAFRVESAIQSVEAWRIADVGSWEPLALVPAIGPAPPDPAIGRIFGPPPGAGDADHGWHAGTYVFRIAEEAGAPRWLAVIVRFIPAETAPAG